MPELMEHAALRGVAGGAGSGQDVAGGRSILLLPTVSDRCVCAVPCELCVFIRAQLLKTRPLNAAMSLTLSCSILGP